MACDHGGVFRNGRPMYRMASVCERCLADERVAHAETRRQLYAARADAAALRSVLSRWDSLECSTDHGEDSRCPKRAAQEVLAQPHPGADLLAELARLRAALQPFATYATKARPIASLSPDKLVIASHNDSANGDTVVTLGDCLRALAALDGGKGGDDGQG